MRIGDAMAALVAGKVVRRKPSADSVPEACPGLLLHEGKLYTEKNTTFDDETQASFDALIDRAGPVMFGACLTPVDFAADDWEVVEDPKPASYWAQVVEDQCAAATAHQCEAMTRAAAAGDLVGFLSALSGTNSIVHALRGRDDEDGDLPFDPDADDAEASAAEFMDALGDEGDDMTDDEAFPVELGG